MLGLISVMTAMLTAMSADASARLSLADKPRLVAPTVTAADTPSANATQITQQTTTNEPPRKKTRKSSRAKCARITGTCWGNA